ELIAMPSSRKWTGLRFAIADDAGHDQIWIVESGPIGMRQRVTQLTTLMDRPRRLGCHMARDASGKAELLEQAPDPVLVLRDVRVNLGIGALQIRMCHERRTAVTRADDIDHVEVMTLDDPIEVNIEKIESGSRAPMANQPRLNMLAFEGFFKERVIKKIDLTHRQIV